VQEGPAGRQLEQAARPRVHALQNVLHDLLRRPQVAYQLVDDAATLPHGTQRGLKEKQKDLRPSPGVR
jgi:hypothetical protein